MKCKRTNRSSVMINAEYYYSEINFVIYLSPVLKLIRAQDINTWFQTVFQDQFTIIRNDSIICFHSAYTYYLKMAKTFCCTFQKNELPFSED